jgi:hypothetical protein
MMPTTDDAESVSSRDSSTNSRAATVDPNDDHDKKPIADQNDGGGAGPTATLAERFAILFNGDGSIYPSKIPWSKTQEFCLEAYVTPTHVNEDQWVIEFRPGISLCICDGE